MKAALFILGGILASTQLLCAQAIQTATFANIGSGASRQKDITLAEDQMFKLLTWAPSYNGPTMLKVDGIDVPVSWSPGSSNVPPVFSPNLVIAGPRTVSLVVPSNQSLVCSYKVMSNTDLVAPHVPSTSVVIPSDAAGPVQVILESSTDLLNWTPANPGSYGASTVKRFFRVRAVAQ